MRKSAIMVLARVVNDDWQIFLMKRAKGKLNEGEWCFPGGKCDWIEEIVKTEIDFSSTLSREIKTVEGRWETYEEAAARECLEETGYKPYVFSNLCDNDIFYSDGTFIGKIFLCINENFELKQNVEYPNNEHSKGIWVNVNDIDGYLYKIGPITNGILDILKGLLGYND